MSNQEKYIIFMNPVTGKNEAKLNPRYIEPRKLLPKWDYRFLKLARDVAGWSKDRTKVGAVIVRPDHSLVSVGFNGLVPGMKDDEYLKDREMKNLCIRHAEENALYYAGRENAKGCTMYLYGLTPCGRCAADISMHKIKKLICVSEPAHPDWHKSQQAADDVLYVKNLNKVDVVKYNKSDIDEELGNEF